jgi:HK97 family phage prohead protease
MGDYNEAFSPGCWNRWLSRNADCHILYAQTTSMVLGRRKAGTCRVWDSDQGLAYSAILPDTSYGRNLLALLRRGDISEASVAMYVLRDRWANVGGINTRFIEESALLYGSIDPFGYDGTSAAIDPPEQEEEEMAVASSEFDFAIDARIHRLRLV